MNTTRIAAIAVAVGLILLVVLVSRGPLDRMARQYGEQLDVAPTHGEWVAYVGAGGDTVAAREVLNRLLGQPESLDLLERLEALERRLADATGAGRR